MLISTLLPIYYYATTAKSIIASGYYGDQQRLTDVDKLHLPRFGGGRP
jgi:hypothetical protein